MEMNRIHLDRELVPGNLLSAPPLVFLEVLDFKTMVKNLSALFHTLMVVVALGYKS